MMNKKSGQRRIGAIIPVSLTLIVLSVCVIMTGSAEGVTSVTINVNGTPSNSMTQGDDWEIIWDLANPGNTAMVEIWIDKNSDHLIDAGDQLFLAERATDGDISDEVFFDADGAVNGSFSWHPSVGNSYINLAPGDWIFKVIDENSSEKAAYLHVEKLPPTNYSISGKVTVPANTEYIWIEAGYEGGAGWYLYAAFTDSGGNYTIHIPDSMGNRTWDVLAGGEMGIPGYLTPDEQEVLIDGHITGMDFAFISATASVEGVVRDDLGSPLPGGIRIEAQEESLDIEIWTWTEADGSYHLDVIGGNWEIAVVEEDVIPDHLASGIDVTINDGETLTGQDIICYRALHTITGRVTKDGAGFPGVWVEAENWQLGWTHAKTDANGAYTLHVADASSFGNWRVELDEWPAGFMLQPPYSYFDIPHDSTNIDFAFITPIIKTIPVTPPVTPPVICVPWRGNEDWPHPTWNGKEISLKGTVRYAGKVEYTWDFGNGTPTESGAVIATDEYPYPISARHTYSGANGTMYVARLTVTANGSLLGEDTYLVEIGEKTLQAEADLAIDEGLWWLYQQQNRDTFDSVDYGYWQQGDEHRVAVTGAAVQAFENNLHKPFGDPAKDPYVDTVKRGLNFLTRMAYPVNIPSDDGDTNGNGIGIGCDDWEWWPERIYEIGMAMMAIVSSDLPGHHATIGPDNVIGRTYKEIVQDMADYCAWAQNEAGTVSGGWRYDPNYSESDNSVTQWPIIGMEPAEAKWGIAIADFVKPRLLDWLTWSQCKQPDESYGGFGYSWPDDWVNIAKTSGTGVTGLLFCDLPQDDQRISDAINFIDSNWNTDTEHWDSYYAMYGVMKAFSDEFLNRESTGNHVWWDEYARYLADKQDWTGSWPAGMYTERQLATAWAIIILTKVVYDIPPTAIAKANGFDEIEVDKDQIVHFDGSQSRDGTYQIILYEWDWESDGIYDHTSTEPTAEHSYFTYLPDPYVVTLRVTDNRDTVTGGAKPAITDTDTCQVYVHPPPHPPIADANGPYIGWVGIPVTLDGSGSHDPNEPLDEIISWDWDLDNDGEFDDASGEIVTYTWNVPGIYPIALRVTAREEPKLGEPSRTIVEIGNHDPVADPNGPYETQPCTPITLDGSGSYDPDPAPDHIVKHEWDLDNDGEYDDATGVAPEFHCQDEGVYIIRLKVTDTYGATGTAETIVKVTAAAAPCCDLNNDNDCDYDDYGLFVGAYGKYAGDPGFIPEADYDGDGRITLVDYQKWYECWKEYYGL